jgi:hypothetical protein
MPDLKLRTDEKTKARLEWGKECQGLPQNSILQAALEAWLDENERIYGPPQVKERPQPLAAKVLSVHPKRKRVGG